MDSISTKMNDTQFAEVKLRVDKFNKELEQKSGRKYSSSLGKDDFLKILVTQLRNQDPMKPMEDKEFVAQMAQFSSLEQMTNMSKSMEEMKNGMDLNKLTSKMDVLGNELRNISMGNRSSAMMNLVGKEVVLIESGVKQTGTVSKVVLGDYPQVFVNGKFYNYDSIQAVGTEE